jgi:hypothetical protein
MAPRHAHARPARSTLSRIAGVTAAALVLVAGFDAATYAATGQSLLLGRRNVAGATTTVTNTGKGQVLNLVARNPAAPPFTTNARGKVTNLDADRLDGLDSVEINRRAHATAPLAMTFKRTGVSTSDNPPATPFALQGAVVSNKVGRTGTYAVKGTISFAPDPSYSGSYSVGLNSITDMGAVLTSVTPTPKAGSPRWTASVSVGNLKVQAGGWIYIYVVKMSPGSWSTPVDINLAGTLVVDVPAPSQPL